jgi:hypothetical protein
MPFKCALCELEIQVGEPMLSDEKMNLAHESCVKRKQANPGSSVVVAGPVLQAVTVTLPHPSDVPLGTKVSVKAESLPPGAVVVVSAGEPCLMPRAPSVCAECQKPAISMCPSCKAYVHQDYGYNGSNCSGRHEGRCSGAADSRKPVKKSAALTQIQTLSTIESTSKSSNGKYAKPNPGRRRR